MKAEVFYVDMTIRIYSANSVMKNSTIMATQGSENVGRIREYLKELTNKSLG